MRIKYFCYYGCTENKHLRSNSPAADAKINYIIDVLNRCGYSVDVVSHAYTSMSGFYHPGFVRFEGNNSFRYFGCFSTSDYFIFKHLNRWYVELLFFWWCLVNVRWREQILVYHSLGYDSTFIKLKYLKNVQIIGEIEEIYQDVHPQRWLKSINEFRFISKCDKYIFSNTVLNERLNKKNAPSLIIYGNYQIANTVKEEFEDNKIHVIYSGTFDPVKGGALVAVKIGEYLPDRFCIHITGFGDTNDMEQILREVNRVNEQSKAHVTFHGFLSNYEKQRLMKKCKIGLCTQNHLTKLNETSFPSKILDYMSNGLIVVAGRNRTVEESAIGDLLYYYEEPSPKAIAKLILSLDSNSGYLFAERLGLLDQELIKQMPSFFS